MGPLAHVGIALGTSLAAWINALALAGLLARRRQLVLDRQARRRGPRLLLASALMGLVLWAAQVALPPGVPVLLLVPGLIGLGAVVFFAALQALGALDLREVRALLRRRRGAQAAA